MDVGVGKSKEGASPAQGGKLTSGIPDVYLPGLDPALYNQLQNLRPDYTAAMNAAVQCACDLTESPRTLTLVDYCCGTGEAARRFAESVGGIERAVLIDQHEGFLQAALQAGIQAAFLETRVEDAAAFRTDHPARLAFAVFAYHHIPDAQKPLFVERIAESLLPDGRLVVAEIFLHTPAAATAYYQSVLNSIRAEQHTPALVQFLEQTAAAADFEYKVPKAQADSDFARRFGLVAELKIWPPVGEQPPAGLSADDGTWVQVYCPGHERSSRALAYQP